MQTYLSRFVPQPLTAVVVCIVAGATLLGAWTNVPVAFPDAVGMHVGIVSSFLAASVVLAGLNPIHILHRTKVTLTTLPLYLAAVLLPPEVAAVTAGVGVLTLQLLTRARHGNLPSDIATATGRWIVVAYLSARVAQLAADDSLSLALALSSTAVVMFAGDVVTGAFEIAPMSGEPPPHVMLMLLREGALIEVAQYLLAMLGALAARQQVWALSLMILPTYIVYAAFKRTKEMHDSTRTLLESMADTVDLRDSYTGGHSRRVTVLAVRLLKELNVFGPEVQLIQAAARVHDIGKIGIPDAILNKPGRLTPDEQRIMNSHPDCGAELLARYPDFARGMEIVRHHHERWDGTGYPKGLKGLDIPFGARVIAVADGFDAMTSDRPYRAALSVSQAARILREGRAQQWDPTMVDAFLRCLAATQQPLSGPLPNAVPAQAASATV